MSKAKKTKSTSSKISAEAVSADKNAVTNKTRFCKELDCSSQAQIKGFCRLHFLKVLAGKSEGNAKPQGDLKLVKERRTADRTKGLEPGQSWDDSNSDHVSTLGELDLDIDPIVDFDPLKTGT